MSPPATQEATVPRRSSAGCTTWRSGGSARVPRWRGEPRLRTRARVVRCHRGGGHGPDDVRAGRGVLGGRSAVPHPGLRAHPPAPVKEGGTTFTFVTDGIRGALDRAKAAAGDGNVDIAGGASTVRQYLGQGLVDELRLHVVPALLGTAADLRDGDAALRDGERRAAGPRGGQGGRITRRHPPEVPLREVARNGSLPGTGGRPGTALRTGGAGGGWPGGGRPPRRPGPAGRRPPRPRYGGRAAPRRP
ncbi:dihydrofolate reductase family protein, partial [Streptomyces hirsutus]|uniref:dihydrofolate reductase family protein n=1 Tax=Streptomyces hirsutus TaxID=35620 RepID=UPI003642E48B